MNGCHYPNELFSQATQRNSNSNSQRKKLSLFGYFVYLQHLWKKSAIIVSSSNIKKRPKYWIKATCWAFLSSVLSFLSHSQSLSPLLSLTIFFPPAALCQMSTINLLVYLKLLRFFTDLECSLLEDLGKVSLSSFVSEDTILVELTSVSLLLYSCNLLPMFSYSYLCQD